MKSSYLIVEEIRSHAIEIQMNIHCSPLVAERMACDRAVAELVRLCNKAQDAIELVLCRIKTDAAVAYYLGNGTQAYKELTAAFAELTGKPVEEVRNMVMPDSAKWLAHTLNPQPNTL